MSWEQLWYTIVGALALIGARLLDRWLPSPHPSPATTVIVNPPPEDDDDSGRHRKRRDVDI